MDSAAEKTSDLVRAERLALPPKGRDAGEALLLRDMLELSSQPMAAGYPKGGFVLFNEAFLQLTGYTREEAGRLRVAEAGITPPRFTVLERRLSRSTQRASLPLSYRMGFTRRDGSPLWIEVTIHPRRDDKGKSLCYFFIKDITARVDIEQNLEGQRALLHTVVENMPAAVALVRGRDLRVVLANAAFRSFSPGLEVVGRPFEETWPDASVPLGDLCRRVLAGGVPHHVPDQEFLIRLARNAAPRKACFTWSLCPVGLPGEPEGGILGTAWDITERKRATQSLREKERELKEAQRLARVRSWYWDLRDDPAAAGGPSGTRAPRSIPSPYGEGELVLEPEALQAFTLAIDEALRTGKGYEIDLPARQGDEPVWITSRCEVLLDGEGRVAGLRGTVQDITERKLLEEKLRQSKEEAETASRIKGRFLANMSHELRTPMNGILGMTQLAQLTCRDQEARGYVMLAEESARHLLAIINDILDFSKLEAGKTALENKPFGLRAVLGSTLKALEVIAQRKSIALRHAVDEALPDELVGDPGRLRQVLTNIVGNAVKFTEAGMVVVTVTQASDLPTRRGGVRVLFQVKDTGIGIPPGETEAIFESFSQVYGSAHAKYGGTGLGLTISRELVEMMGGRIWVESELGRGSTFSFTAEFSRAAAEPDREPRSGRLPEGPLKVLVAMDNLVARALLADLLSVRGHEVTLACNGREAVNILKENAHHLALLDARMPEMDGMEAAALIRAGQALEPDVPILAILSGGEQASLQEAVLAAGMDGHVVAPVDLGQLDQALARLRARRNG